MKTYFFIVKTEQNQIIELFVEAVSEQHAEFRALLQYPGSLILKDNVIQLKIIPAIRHKKAA